MNSAVRMEIEKLIINMVRSEPSLYDKSLDSYAEEYRDRDNKYNIISQAIFSIYQELWTEIEIKKTWERLLKKFKEEYKNVNSYQPSGSARQNIVQKSNWAFYDEMLFMVPHIQHMPLMSSLNEDDDEYINILESKNTKNTADLRQFFKRKRIASTEEDLEESLKIHKEVTEKISRVKENIELRESLVDNYINCKGV